MTAPRAARRRQYRVIDALWRPSLLTLVTLLALFGSAVTRAASARGPFLVPTAGAATGFGAFSEGQARSAAALRDAFGKPSSVDAERGACVMGWKSRGIVAKLTTYGQEINPCRDGYFLSARLTDRRWHTSKGVRPGSSVRAARRDARRRCTQSSCGVSGFALELHRTDCGSGLVPGVIAEVRRSRVVALVVQTRGCE